MAGEPITAQLLNKNCIAAPATFKGEFMKKKIKKTEKDLGFFACQTQPDIQFLSNHEIAKLHVALQWLSDATRKAIK